MTPLPTISIVVPNFNGGKTIARTLQSLLDQDYPGLEIIVMDGGSTDDSVAIIRRFEKHLAFWTSQRDRGQSDAINRGFARATGQIVNWLCSDDVLTPGALHIVGRHFAQNPSTDVLVGAACINAPSFGRRFIVPSTPDRIRLMPCMCLICQPSTFYRRMLLDRPGPLDESLHYAMDLELWCYFQSRGARWACTKQVLSEILIHPDTKNSTAGEKMIQENERVYQRYVRDESIPLTFWHRRLRLPLERLRKYRRDPVIPRLAKLADFAVVLALGPFYGLRRVHAMSWYPWA